MPFFSFTSETRARSQAMKADLEQSERERKQAQERLQQLISEYVCDWLLLA